MFTIDNVKRPDRPPFLFQIFSTNPLTDRLPEGRHLVQGAPSALPAGSV
jgi:hypothetical protein